MLGDDLKTNQLDFAALEKDSLAVLVIDILGDPDLGPLAPVMKPVVKNAARICASARQAGIPVVFLNDAHLPGLDRELLLWGEHGIAGSEAAQPAAALGLCAADYVVEKRRYSGFFQTGLRLLLDELGVKNLICIGMDTNICVRHTVADAYFNNYSTIVVDDATLTFLVGDQAEGLAYMQTCYASHIATADEVVELLSR